MQTLLLFCFLFTKKAIIQKSLSKFVRVLKHTFQPSLQFLACLHSTTPSAHTAIFKLGRLFNMLKMFSLSNINH